MRKFPKDPVETIINPDAATIQKELGRFLLDRGDARKRVERVIEILGDSLKLTEADYFVVIKHLLDLSQIPETILRFAVRERIRTRIGFFDATDFLNNFGDNKLMGEPEEKDILGFYEDRTAYSGDRLPCDPSFSSISIHELGHGIDEIFPRFESERIAHIRLYAKLRSHVQQDSPGCNAGIRELMADSFADYFKLSEKEFISKYDEAWHQHFHNFISGLLVEIAKEESEIELAA